MLQGELRLLTVSGGLVSKTAIYEELGERRVDVLFGQAPVVVQSLVLVRSYLLYSIRPEQRFETR